MMELGLTWAGEETRGHTKNSRNTRPKSERLRGRRCSGTLANGLRIRLDVCTGTDSSLFVNKFVERERKTDEELSLNITVNLRRGEKDANDTKN